MNAPIDRSPDRRTTRRVRLGFVGPHLGGHDGWVTTQSEIMARLFAAEGHSVRATSTVRSPVLRVVDMARSLIAWRREIDVVVLSVFSGRAFAVADAIGRLLRLLRLPQVHVLRGGAFPELAGRRPRWARSVLARADAVVAPSGFLAEHAARLDLQPTVIPNLVDLEQTPFRLRTRLAGPVRLLWVRTFHPIYHPRLALETLARLRARGVEATLTMAGQDKGLEGECRSAARALGLEDIVRFPGFLDAEDKRREFASHDVFLNTNRVDNTPVTVIEACAFGLPVVATAVGGLPFLLDDGATGLLVSSEDADAMAAAVLRLREEPDLAERLSRGGRELAEGCAWPSVRERWLELFDRLTRPVP